MRTRIAALCLLAAVAAFLAIIYSLYNMKLQKQYRELKEQSENLTKKHHEADVELTIRPGEAVKKYEELRQKYHEMKDARNELLVLKSLMKAYDLLKQMAKKDDDWQGKQKKIDQYDKESGNAFKEALRILGTEIEDYRKRSPLQDIALIARLEERAQLSLSQNNKEEAEKAKADYKDALDLQEKHLIKDEDSVATYDRIARALGNLYKLKDSEAHCKLFERALEAKVKVFDQASVPLVFYQAYMNLGLAYRTYPEKFENAELNFKKAIGVIKAAQDHNLEPSLVAPHKELGDLYWYQSRKYIPWAGEQYDEALRYVGNKVNSDAVEIRLGLALVYCSRHKIGKAKKEAAMVLDGFKTLSDNQLIDDEEKGSLINTISSRRGARYTRARCKNVEELIAMDKFK